VGAAGEWSWARSRLSIQRRASIQSNRIPKCRSFPWRRSPRKSRFRSVAKALGEAPAILKVRNFWDSRISKSLIQGWDAALALPSCRPEGHLCDFSRWAKGAWRQYRDRRFRPCGVLDVFHAERFVSGLSARAGKGPGPLQRSDVVWHRQNPLRQLHSRHAGRGRPCASATLFRTHGDAAGGACHASGFRSARRQNPDRLGWDAVFLLAKARLSELSHPRALQRQKAIIACCRPLSWRLAIPRSSP
jgi:hypothetical protein